MQPLDCRSIAYGVRELFIEQVWTSTCGNADVSSCGNTHVAKALCTSTCGNSNAFAWLKSAPGTSLRARTRCPCIPNFKLLKQVRLLPVVVKDLEHQRLEVILEWSRHVNLNAADENQL